MQSGANTFLSLNGYPKRSAAIIVEVSLRSLAKDLRTRIGIPARISREKSTAVQYELVAPSGPTLIRLNFDAN
jgi:hypothetical protein